MDEQERLTRAVVAGIISPEQRSAILALADASDGASGPAARFERPDRRGESPRGFNAATIAYVAGGLSVILAFVWFLGDRWRALGPSGVLVVSMVYAAILLLTANRLRHFGYPTAANFSLLLLVALAPVTSWSLLELSGLWQEPDRMICRTVSYPFWGCRQPELLMELTAALVALVCLRAVRFSPFVAPLAAIAIRGVFHLSDGLGQGGYGYGNATQGWIWMIAASLMIAAAYTTDRRQRGDEDFAFWLHLAAAVSAVVATMFLLNRYEYLKHLLIPGALVAVAVALTLRRIVWLLLGLGWFVGYLIWLATEVFRGTPVFPVVLATLGILLIVITVQVQRNAARLIQRFGTVTSDGRPRFPGGVPLLLSPILVAVLMFGDAADRDREAREDARVQGQLWRRRSARAAMAQRDSVLRLETPPAVRP